MRVNTSSFLFLYFWGLSLSLAQYHIKGKVMHVENNKPVVGAVVFINEIKKGSETDTAGNFTFKNIAEGEYTLKVIYIGHKPLVAKVKTSGDTYLEYKIENLPESTEEIVVTATMKDMNKLDLPIPVEVYTPAFFKKNPTPNIFESLGMVNGVQPQIQCNVCNTGDIHINGMEGPYTMVLIDGMPIVSSLSTVYGLMGIPNSMVKRIEVVKGPGATLYGSEAVGGIINIITKDVAGIPKIGFDVMGTSYYDYNVDFTAKVLMGKSSALIGANYYNMGTKWDKNEDNFTDVTLQNRFSVFNKWAFDRKMGRTSSIAMRLFSENRWGGEMQWEPRWRGTDVVYGESIYTNRVELIGHYQLPMNTQKITLQYSYNYHYQDSFYGTNAYIGLQHVGFAQLLWDKNISLRHSLLIGVPMRYIFYDDNTPGTASINGNLPQNTYLPGVLVQDEYKISDKILLLAGARYDHSNYHGSIYSGRGAIKYSPNKNNVLRLATGNGFRVVNLFTEDHAALSGAREVLITEALKPETSWNINVNYTKFVYHKYGFLSIDAGAFYTIFGNKIVGDFETDPNKIIYDNLKGHAVSRGLSLNLDFSFTNGLKVLLGGTFMEVYQVEKNTNTGLEQKMPQLHAPMISGVYQVSYTIPQIKLTLDYTGRVYGPMHLPVLPYDYRNDRSPWFDLANIQVTKKLPYNIELYIGTKNLWNFVPKHPIMRPYDPFDKNVGVNNAFNYTFDPSYNYAPLQGIRAFAGLRFQLME